MRIVAGRFRGHHLSPPPRRGVRPTSDPVREALFNILAGRPIGLPFLDLAAGTGAVGLEALSRGASPVWLVEKDAGAVRVIRRNLELLHLDPRGSDELRIIQADVGTWLAGPALEEVPPPVGIAFFDPPYGERKLARWVATLAGSGLLDAESLVVIEHRTGDAPDIGELELRWVRRYGDTSLTAAGLPEGPLESAKLAGGVEPA